MWQLAVYSHGNSHIILFTKYLEIMVAHNLILFLG